MQQYRLSQTELSVSRLAYGTWHLGGSWDKTPVSDALKARAETLIRTAFEAGINHIDLSDIYTLGKSDEVVGYALAQHPALREKLVLQQKCGIIIAHDEDFGPPGRYDFSYEHLVGALERSLKRLGTDYVDIFTLHRPDPLVDYEEVARAFDYLEREGRVRHFGVSNHSAAQIALLQKHVQQPLVVNQLELSLLHPHLISDGVLVNNTVDHNDLTGGTFEYCRLHNIMVQAWSPVAGGQFFHPADDAPVHVKTLAAEVARLAREKETTLEAIGFAWLLRHPAGIQPIIGTRTPSRIVDSVKADEITLSRAEWYSLLEAARGKAVP